MSAEPHLVAVTLVVLGASWGGLRALEVVLSGLPAEFGAPVVVAQHRQPGARELLAGLLDAHTALDVRDARDHDALVAGRVLVAPADRHLRVEGDHVELSREAEVRHSRPSIDVLFESAARTHGRGTVGVVLTGANEDGARGLQAVRAGGRPRDRAGPRRRRGARGCPPPRWPARAPTTCSRSRTSRRGSSALVGGCA